MLGDGGLPAGGAAANGRTIVGTGKGDGLTTRKLRDEGGDEKYRLTRKEMPIHTAIPSGWCKKTNQGPDNRVRHAAPYGGSHWPCLTTSGGDKPHINRPPFLALTCCERM